MADLGAIADMRHDPDIVGPSYPARNPTAIQDWENMATAMEGIGWGFGSMMVEGMIWDGQKPQSTPERTIGGTTMLLGDTPVPRLVRVYHRATGTMVAQVTSNNDGTWAVSGALTGEYFVVCLPEVADDANAVILDRIGAV